MVFTDFSAGFPWLKVYSAADHHIVPFAIGAEARFSPDGKWIAYVGPLTVPGANTIFIAPFPGPGGRIRVSSGSGAQPTWAHDGRRLFYVAPDRKLMGVDLMSGQRRPAVRMGCFGLGLSVPVFLIPNTPCRATDVSLSIPFAQTPRRLYFGRRVDGRIKKLIRITSRDF